MLQLLIVVFLSPIALAADGPIKDLDSSQTFYGAKLGAKLKTYRGLKQLDTNAGVISYFVEGNNKKFAGHLVTRTVYRVRDKKLHEIELFMLCRPNFYKDLRAELGDGLQMIKGRDEFRWLGKNIVLEYKGYCNHLESFAARLRVRLRKDG